ncbi:AAA family ATPase [Thalassoroseus pseudoceratinae]|uniref:AAA family ATPase n=1 Tax=Thalassoroseus pseudoceratinae TaxID=2713176 RepID=UPI001423513C|nr:hypothetical protein [Thalassoroseus pseudoceratinae]
MKRQQSNLVSLIVSSDQELGRSIQTTLQQMGIDCLPELLPMESLHANQVNATPQTKLYFIDVRNRTNQAITLFRKLKHQSNSNYIAIGDRTNPYEVIEILKEGADDFLDVSENLHFQVVNAIKRTQAKSAAIEANSGSLTIVTGAAGGSGTSMVAQNLAIASMQDAQTCGLLDFDLRKGDQSSLLNLRPIHTLADLCENYDVLDQKMVEQSFTTHESGLRVLASPERITEGPDITADMLRRVTEMALEIFDQIIIDVPAFHLAEYRNLLERCDRLVILFRTDFSSVKNTMRQLETLRELEFELGNLDLVANKWGASTTIDTEEIQKAISFPIPLSISDDPKVIHCVNCGKPIITEWPNAEVSKAINRIYMRRQGKDLQNTHPYTKSWLGSVLSKCFSQKRVVEAAST